MQADYLDKVRAAADFLCVVSAITSARMVGGEWLARCPFHETQDHAMHFDVMSKEYRCDECGVSGDVFQFVCAALGLNRDEAVDWVAECNKTVVR